MDKLRLSFSLQTTLQLSSTRLTLFSSIVMVYYICLSFIYFIVIIVSFNFNIVKRMNFIMRSGVIWKGDKLIDGVRQTLDVLRSKVSQTPSFHLPNISLIFLFFILF